MLSIKRVVLYKHGVGHFEREGLVTGNAVVPLQFKQREVSDVLKSLTVLDLDGGVISTVSYDSTTPVEQLLAEIAISIPDQDSLTSLLPQLKGARLSIRPTAATPAIIGTLLGIDTVADGETGRARKFRLSILTEASDIRSFDLFDIELQLLDDGLKRDLDFYLKTQLAAKKKDARTFTLVASGDGERRLRASYVLEAPVWKATYRLLLAADGEVPPKPHMIQGWAVVDNTSDEDWEGVALTLVAGLPVSFTHDLYTPRHVRRPVVEVQETTGVLPLMAEAVLDDILYGGAGDDFIEGNFAVAAAAPMTMRSARMAKSSMVERSSPSSVSTQTITRTVGDLFEYTIDTPVTVRRNQSALVPIVLKPFKGQTVLLYQKQARAGNPIRCVEFENTTGLTLEGGPVTVLDQGSYVGEAMLDTMKPGETRLVGYAVELAVRVSDTIERTSDRVTRIVINGGTLVASSIIVIQTTYVFASTASTVQRCYVDHSRPRELGGDWRLVEPAGTHQITENYWRLKADVAANATTRLTVRTERAEATNYGLHHTTETQLQAWVSDRWIDKATAAALQAAFDVRRRIAEFESQVQRLNVERQQLHGEQVRIRDNLKALNERPSEKDLRERYIRTLTQQEDRLDAIERDAAKTVADLASAKNELTARLSAVAFSGAVS